MSKLSENLNSPQPRNFAPRAVLSEVLDNVTAARACLGAKPKQASIALDLALGGIVKVIRGIDPDFDFGLPDASALTSLIRDQAATVNQLEAENTELRAELAKVKSKPKAAETKTEELPVLEVPSDAPAEAPKRRGRPPKVVEPKLDAPDAAEPKPDASEAEAENA